MGGEALRADGQERVGRGRGVGQDRQPADAVIEGVRREGAVGYCGAADAMVAVAARDESAGDGADAAVRGAVADGRLIAGQVVQGDVRGLEAQVSAVLKVRGSEFLDQHLLRAEAGRRTFGAVVVGHQMGLAVDPDLQDAFVRNTAQDAVGQPPGVEHAHSAGFDDAARWRCATYSRVWRSRTTQSMPLRCNRFATVRPAGPAPITTTVVDSDDVLNSPVFSATWPPPRSP